MTFSFYAIQNRIVLLQLRQTLPSPLCMEISHILRKLIIKNIINLIEKCRYFCFMLVFQCNTGFFSERHLKITIEASGRIHHDRERIYQTFSCKPTAEKISQWTFHRRFFFIVPVNPQNQITQHVIIFFRTVCHSHPDMLYHTRSFHFSQYSCFSWNDLLHAGRAFSACAEASCCHSAFSLFTFRIFLIDTTALSLFLKHQ